MKENEPKKFSHQKVLPFSFSFGRSSLRHHARTTILNENYFYEIKALFVFVYARRRYGILVF